LWTKENEGTKGNFSMDLTPMPQKRSQQNKGSFVNISQTIRPYKLTFMINTNPEQKNLTP